MDSLGCRLRIALVAGLFLSGFLVARTEAVVVSTTQGNTTAPTDDFGFANVGVKDENTLGTWDDTTGIYLGYRWVLTAWHVTTSNITLNGQSYVVESGTTERLTNPSDLGLSQYTDLRLYRITKDPWLPTLKIAETPLDVSDEVILVGNGQNRANDVTAWDVNGTTWTVTTPPGDREGYYFGSGRTLRWGTNRVNETGISVELSTTNQFAGFSTDFDQYPGGINGATAYEAQATPGDSGGGVFHKNDEQWELSGLIHAVSEYANQPQNAQPLFGLDTFCSDLSIYRDLIVNTIAPLPGDATLDGWVNAIDASIMAANWGQQGTLWGHGDFNEDGTVDALDAAILAQHWGEEDPSWHPPVVEAALGVPEPSMVVLLAVGLMGLAARRRTRRSGCA
ncbi:MAG TPA: dockerin type I domain-containing protein [Thermoguttaceae bacterium]|nr:dockerin type I domain-containing protein [Thermoguttaceae bacterium]